MKVWTLVILLVSWAIATAAQTRDPPSSSGRGEGPSEIVPKNPIVELKTCNKNKFVETFELPHEYNKYELPTARNQDCKFEQLPVTVGIRIRNIRGVIDLNEEISMELDLITTWRDHILAHVLSNKTREILDEERDSKFLALEAGFLDYIWQPDIIFSRAVSITKPSIYSTNFQNRPTRLRIFPDGFVELYQRLLVNLYCPMDFKYFPADTQTCNVSLRSYSFSNNDVNLTWHKIFKNLHNESEGKKELVYFFNRGHPNYRIHLHSVDESIQDEFDAEQEVEHYTYLRFSLSVKRKFTFHAIQTFIPIVFLVVITWLTFFIPLSNLEARIAVAMTTLLTMTNKFSEVGTYTPNVSYVTAMDIYMFMSISIVFLTLFEFTFLYWIRMGRTEYAQSRVSMKKKLPSKNNARRVIITETFEIDEATDDGAHTRFYWKVRNCVEVYGFLLTIIVFVLFNICFWPWMFVNSNYFNHDINFDYNEPLTE